MLVLPWFVMEDDLSGQPPIGFFLLFLLGFLLLGDERIYRTIARHWVWILCLGVAASLAYIWAEPRAGGFTGGAGGFAAVKGLYELGVWCVILGLLGLAYRFFTAGGPVLSYATEAAYPFYILHQTVIVVIACFVVQWDWAAGLKYAAIAVASFALSLHLPGGSAALGPGALPLRHEAEEEAGRRAGARCGRPGLTAAAAGRRVTAAGPAEGGGCR